MFPCFSSAAFALSQGSHFFHSASSTRASLKVNQLDKACFLSITVCDLVLTQNKILISTVSLTQHGPKLSLYLYEMLHDHKDGLTKDEQNAVGVFMTSLKLCGHRCIPPNAPHKQDLLKAIKEARGEQRQTLISHTVSMPFFSLTEFSVQQYEGAISVQVEN